MRFNNALDLLQMCSKTCIHEYDGTFFDKSTFPHARQREKKYFFHAEITFFHAGITFFHTGITFLHTGITFFHTGYTFLVF
jgi:hypothetical protein